MMQINSQHGVDVFVAGGPHDNGVFFRPGGGRSGLHAYSLTT
jgi:hypothetical protein